MKHIIFIHGRATKPLEQNLRMLWYEAIVHGLNRDFGDTEITNFHNVSKKFVYYGHISNEFLHENNGDVIPDDYVSRLASLEQMKVYMASDFNKDNYNLLPGKNSTYEFFADLLSSPLSLFSLGQKLIGTVAPDMREYWNPEAYFGSDIRFEFTKALVDAFDDKKNHKILIVAHSLGSIVAYDCLWKLSHYGEYRSKYQNCKIDLITLGSPLGDENVKKELKGKNSIGLRKYPHNIKSWTNISAEDDYICHDSKIANDFREMVDLKLINNIKDINSIYNLTVRNGKSNPHSAIGYLIHPEFIKVLNNWLSK